MIQDIFIPSRIGLYYFFEKRILGFEINSSSVQATLVHFSKNKVVLKNNMSITLQDQNPLSISNAIKKITTTIGKYDEIVTCLTSSTVIFKEMILPFVGREKIKMIIDYEVEPLLPFTLNEAVIDFIITDEDKVKSQTTVLVAAVRKLDLLVCTSHFEAAGIELSHVTLDMFALYDFYRNAMYVAQAYMSLLIVDFSFDAIRILYIQKGILKSVRLVPYGLTSITNNLDKDSTLLQHRLLENNLPLDIKDDHEGIHKELSQKIMVDFCKQITLSISFFQKQIKSFIAPSKIICLGAGTGIQGFLEQAKACSDLPVEILEIKKILLKNNVVLNKTIKFDAQYSSNLIIPFSAVRYGDVNFLSDRQKQKESKLFKKQILMVIFISLSTIAGLYLYTDYQVRIWNVANAKSKRDLVMTLQEQMNLDVKNVKRVSEIVSTAQTQLEQTKKVCFSFSQSNNSFLHSLQELYSKIDRTSLGLSLKLLSLHDNEVVLQGKVKDYDALATFEEELMELENFTLQDKPRDLAFTVVLHIKDQHDKN